VIRNITLCAEKEKLGFGDALARHPEAQKAVYAKLRELGHADPSAFFSSPQLYRGKASEKAREIAARYRALALRYALSPPPETVDDRS